MKSMTWISPSEKLLLIRIKIDLSPGPIQDNG
jgi:hypothetical protein